LTSWRLYRHEAKLIKQPFESWALHFQAHLNYLLNLITSSDLFNLQIVIFYVQIKITTLWSNAIFTLIKITFKSQTILVPKINLSIWIPGVHMIQTVTVLLSLQTYSFINTSGFWKRLNLKCSSQCFSPTEIPRYLKDGGFV
jgi:hypothetical protein